MSRLHQGDARLKNKQWRHCREGLAGQAVPPDAGAEHAHSWAVAATARATGRRARLATAYNGHLCSSSSHAMHSTVINIFLVELLTRMASRMQHVKRTSGCSAAAMWEVAHAGLDQHALRGTACRRARAHRCA